MTVTATETVEPAAAAAENAPVYHLHLQPRPRVSFNADVVDNEHLGRKKSNSEPTLSSYDARRGSLTLCPMM